MKKLSSKMLLRNSSRPCLMVPMMPIYWKFIPKRKTIPSLKKPNRLSTKSDLCKMSMVKNWKEKPRNWTKLSLLTHLLDSMWMTWSIILLLIWQNRWKLTSWVRWKWNFECKPSIWTCKKNCQWIFVFLEINFEQF